MLGDQQIRKSNDLMGPMWNGYQGSSGRILALPAITFAHVAMAN